MNQYVQADHFKMEGLHYVKQSVTPGDWLAKIDLKDTYFSIRPLPSVVGPPSSIQN